MNSLICDTCNSPSIFKFGVGLRITKSAPVPQWSHLQLDYRTDIIRNH